MQYWFKINIKNSIPEYDKERLIIDNKGFTHPESMGESKEFRLGDKGEFDVVMLQQPLFNHVAKVADNNNGLIDSCCDKFIHNVANDGFPRHIEQYFGM